MTGILIASHGPLAVGIKETLEMVIGQQDNMMAVGLKFGQSLDDFVYEIKKALNELDNSKGIMAFVDMRGGTPFNALATVLCDYADIIGITGVNLPMLSEICQSRDELSLSELETLALEVGSGSVFSVNKLFSDEGYAAI